MPGIIATVEKLVRDGHAYAADGDVYFDISTYPRYGQLSRLDPEGMIAESRRQKMRPGPRHPLDFLLWQAQAPGEPAWASPWGEGRPGWHIECSAMAQEHLGARVDLHGGGGDLVYPHHESEIAQSESATGEAPFVRYWVHVAMLRYQGEKMSKSLGNMVFAHDLLNDYPADAVRLSLFSHHYRESWEFHDDEIVAAADQARRLREAVAVTGGDGPSLDPGPATARVTAALDDDLNLPAAVRALLDLADEIAGAARRAVVISDAQGRLRQLAGILGLTLL
jgi:cysteinyl-tRNA synthetase